MSELKKNIEKLEEKYFIKEEMTKETYDRFLLKYREEFTLIQKELDSCTVSISNLQEMLNEVVILSRNLRKLWHEGSIGLKEKLQRLLFPSGLVYDKKTGAFRTSEINFIIAQIARHTGDFAIIKKGLSSLFESKSLCAVRTGLEPATSAVTGRHSNQLNYRTNSSSFESGVQIYIFFLKHKNFFENISIIFFLPHNEQNGWYLPY